MFFVAVRSKNDASFRFMDVHWIRLLDKLTAG